MDEEDQRTFESYERPGEEVANALTEDPADLHSEENLVDNGSIEETPRNRWRVAKSLEVLRAAVNQAAPRRSKLSDGTRGDAAHQSRDSDHNPWVIDGGVGVVTALDITHDPDGACDAHLLAEVLRKSRDPRIKYIISNRRMASSYPKGSTPAWAWRTYTGTNPHTQHAHFSVSAEKSLYDRTTPWPIDDFISPTESLAGGEGEEEALAQVERGLDALLAAAGERPDAPLLVRLADLGVGAEILLERYAQAVRAPAEPTFADEDDALHETPPPNFAQLREEYVRLFASCAIRPEHAGTVTWHRRKLLAGKARYQSVEQRTGVPWWFVGIVHGLEASFNFSTHLHNGDPLTARTVQIPRNRPPGQPPFTWLESAIDALTIKNFVGLTDWSTPRALFRWEGYNGFGYRRSSVNIPSPYLWSFSNHYSRGKFVRDGVYDRNAVSKQCGAAVMLKSLQLAGDVAL